jgi:hypothetical protein
MKKVLLILLIFFSFQLTAQKGYWLCKNYRVIDSTKGWGVGEIGLIIDFTNSKLMHLLKDTIIDININNIKKTISFKNEIDTIRYSVKKSSIELKVNNTKNIFQEFEFNNELNFSKEKIERLLIDNKVILEKDSIIFQFEDKRNISSSKFRTLNYFWRGKRHKGLWCVEKIKENVFIGMTDDEDWGSKMNIYRVISMNDKFLYLEIIKDYFNRSKNNIKLMIKK